MLSLIIVYIVFCQVCVGFYSSVSRIGFGPEAFMNTSELIRSNGYPCEDHEAFTDDGYILDLQRIPHGRNRLFRGARPPVLLQHGLMSSSVCWVENLANQSLGFILADAGFDVWLGNNRGNSYGVRHSTLSPTQEEFWTFSWDEMAFYDLPAIVYTVLNITGQKTLYYVGHSQGSEIAFAALSNNPDLASKIRLFVALAPAAYLGHNKEAVRFLDWLPEEVIYNILGRKEFPPDAKLLRRLGAELCEEKESQQLCFLIWGFNPKEINSRRIPVFLGHNPEGTSVKNMVHYTQALQSGNFQMFDYGKDGNMRKYKQAIPPMYNISSIRTMTALFAGSADVVTVPLDVARLARELKNLVVHKEIQGWGHMDFVWSMNAPSLCYQYVLSLFRKFI